MYLNELNLNLFNLADNIILNSSLPNILITLNNVVQLNNNLYSSYNYRKLSNIYYNEYIYSNKDIYDILEYNNASKYTPTLFLLNKSKIIKFTDSFIYLDKISIELLTEANYLIIQNNNFFYTTIIHTDNNGIYINTNLHLLDNKYDINIYYSYSNLVYNNN